MSAKADIEDLERQLADLRRGLIASQSNIEKVSKQIEGLRQKVEGLEVSLNSAKSNLRFMRAQADHVVLQEFDQVKKSAADLADELDNTRMQLAMAESSFSKLNQTQPLIKNAIKQRTDKLKEFGKVEPIGRKSKKSGKK